MDKKDIEKILDIIADLYDEYNISELGFDLVEFCKKAEIVLVPYSSYENKTAELIRIDEDGFNFINPLSNSCEIYYNDCIEPKQRLKFTIPHEIGHIMLGHNQTIHNETEEQKRQADFFANEFYCPSILLLKFGILTVPKLISTFGITASYANVLLDKLVKKTYYDYSESEKRLLNNFLKNQKKEK